jgi:hypothetical protein
MSTTLNDPDATILAEAGSSTIAIGRALRLAINRNDYEAIGRLSPEYDRVTSAYSSAQLRLIAPGMLSVPADVTALREIRSRIDSAANTEDMIRGALQLVGFLMKFA